MTIMEQLPERIDVATRQVAHVLYGQLIPRFRSLKFQGQLSWSELRKELDSVSPEAANLIESAKSLRDVFNRVKAKLRADGFDVIEMSVDSNIYSKRQIHYSARLLERSLVKTMFSYLLVAGAVFMAAMSAHNYLHREVVIVYEK